uniref:E3 ubiquitin-protein ligase MARCHF3 isoform X2 n=1 Tax=Myxine glutinosa TaxID=7769 RepID=UPI0035900003
MLSSWFIRMLSTKIPAPASNVGKYSLMSPDNKPVLGTDHGGADCLPRESPFCRICHEGGSQEDLLSPCDCIGTLGSLHQTCLEHWLAASNTSFCELCHFQFVVERKPQPFTKWLQSPNPKRERRTLLSDILCFIFITPLAGISGWLCLRGALDHLLAKHHNQLEAAGLIGLTVALLAIYMFWTAVSIPPVSHSFVPRVEKNSSSSEASHGEPWQHGRAQPTAQF